MDIDNISIQDLKKCRPDLYQAIRQEACLEELRLTKDDIISMIEPLSEKLKECLSPYLSDLSAKTYNDIVDMENDIIEEISEQLQDEFIELEKIVGERPPKKAKRIVEPTPITKTCDEDVPKLDLLTATLEDLKKFRLDLCDLLYDEYLKASSVKHSKVKENPKEEIDDDTNGIKLGDALHWNYTKEEGIVVGFDSSNGGRKIIVEQYDGTKIYFENDPKLYKLLKGEEKANLISKRESYIAQSKERDEKEKVAHKKTSRAKTIYDGVVYDEPTRRGSKLKVGDFIRFKLTKGLGVVKGFMRKGGLDRIVMGYSNGMPESIIDNSEAYEIVDDHPKQTISPKKVTPTSRSSKSKYFPERNMVVRKAKIGDMIQRKSDGLIGRVVEIEELEYGIERLILALEDGSQSGVFNETSMYYVLED